ncbi:Riboflavin synthase [Candidatus Xenohaliotis californiensis]|uniref:Riboflavin synthase n=1 Tax=Candidatus Xenohaliotis californiensis TaxID=84677 RepID=A0ABM9N8G8_9RICK|nr:Riboflavin synthase [Candidatus Xenohaliotis californiensis]
MFSGIVESIGKVSFFNKSDNGAYLGIETKYNADNVVVGDSIACSGVCLTVVAIKAAVLCFDVSVETLTSTGIDSWQNDSMVNIERSLCLGDRIGGHFVYGHVDCIGRVISRKKVGNGYIFDVAINKILEPYIVCKGAVTVDGVSLTVNSIKDAVISFFIIPHTFRSTIFSLYNSNSIVNIEVDAVARYVIDYIRS